MKHVLLSAIVILVLPGILLNRCSSSNPKSPTVIKLEEYRLAGPPELSPLNFRPVGSTQALVLARHADERSAAYQKNIDAVGGYPAIAAIGDDGDFLAELKTSPNGSPLQTIVVLHNGEEIFETSAGLPSPVLPLQGLWTYAGHWALEILFADQNSWSGEVYIDGKSVNTLNGYDESFGLQLLAGKPFFFFERKGKIGYSYDGRETDLAYSEIPHYRCCAESSLNPVQTPTMTAFFAVQGKTWYFVELGAFAGE